MSKKPKIKAPTKTEYRNSEINMALGWCPDIRPCRKCKWPCFDGYCCTYCGDDGSDDE